MEVDSQSGPNKEESIPSGDRNEPPPFDDIRINRYPGPFNPGRGRGFPRGSRYIAINYLQKYQSSPSISGQALGLAAARPRPLVMRGRVIENTEQDWFKSFTPLNDILINFFLDYKSAQKQ